MGFVAIKHRARVSGSLLFSGALEDSGAGREASRMSEVG